jgi:hypothetical protein
MSQPCGCPDGVPCDCSPIRDYMLDTTTNYPRPDMRQEIPVITISMSDGTDWAFPIPEFTSRDTIDRAMKRIAEYRHQPIDRRIRAEIEYVVREELRQDINTDRAQISQDGRVIANLRTELAKARQQIEHYESVLKDLVEDSPGPSERTNQARAALGYNHIQEGTILHDSDGRSYRVAFGFRDRLPELRRVTGRPPHQDIRYPGEPLRGRGRGYSDF